MPSVERATELTIERQVHGGRGLARLADGRIALVTGGIPGERVIAELETRKGVLLGKVTEVLIPSADRVESPLHPGLDMAHIGYPKQLELKRQVVEDALRRATGTSAAAPPVTPAPAQWRYRNAVQPAVADGLGYRVPGTNEFVGLAEDPTAAISVDGAWQTVSEFARSGGSGTNDRGNDRGNARGRPLRNIREVAIRGNDDGESLVALIGTGPSGAALDFAHRLVESGIAGVAWAPYDPRGRFRGGSEKLTGKRSILQRFGSLELTVTATTFSQPNPAAAAELYAELKRWATPGSRAVDLFAGGGAIAMTLADSYDEVTAVEVDKGSVERGKRDAQRLGCSNVGFVRTDARRLELESGPELYVVDPPRAGLAAELRAKLAAATSGQLIYVSCDVATWARDVADLERRGLRLTRYRPYDFFPHTHHIEVLSLLERSAD